MTRTWLLTDPFEYTSAKSELSVRAYNVLKREGTVTIQDLLNLTPTQIRNMRNVGTKASLEITALQKELRHMMQRRIPIKTQVEDQLEFSIRVLTWDAWWQGHDSACEDGADCGNHLNPHDNSDSESECGDWPAPCNHDPVHPLP